LDRMDLDERKAKVAWVILRQAVSQCCYGV
jgi:hypothetical protein